jgi:hypothetical protein
VAVGNQCCRSGSGAFLPLDPGWLKIQDTDPGSGYRMNIPDHISESLEIPKFFAADPYPGQITQKKVTTYFYNLKSYKKQSMD